MSVGEKTIDDQHKKLLNQINKIVQILSSFDSNLISIIETNPFLSTYFKENFIYE